MTPEVFLERMTPEVDSASSLTSETSTPDPIYLHRVQ